jgi:hypothetical protein
MRGLELACSVIVAVYVAARALGDEEPLRFLARYALLAVAGFIGEDSVIRAYGFYFYSLRWDLFLDRVPLAIVLIWPVVIHSAWDLSRKLCRVTMWVPLVGAAIVLADASLIEPIAVQAGLWRWTQPGLFAVPPIGILGWSFFALGCIAVLQHADRSDRGRRLGLPALVIGPLTAHALLVVTWWTAFKWLSRPLPGWPFVVALWLVSALVTRTLVRRRLGARVPLGVLYLRVPGAAFFFVLLAPLLATEPLLGWYAIAFVPPYLALVVAAREKNRPSPV